MIKVTFCLHRLPSLSREEFFDYWFNQHAPLVRRQREALRMRRYVQCHTVETPLNAAMARPRGAPAEIYDGYAQVWWESEEVLRAVMDSAEGREAGRILIEDEKKFVDLGRSPIWFGEERPIFE